MILKTQSQKTGLLSLLISFLRRLFYRDTSEKSSPTETPKKSEKTQIDMPQVLAMLRVEEGVKDKPYRDSKGYLTIGVGHLMDYRLGAYLPPRYQNELDKNGRLSKESIDALLIDDVNAKIADLERYLPWVFRLDRVRLVTLIDMCFQMGIGYPPDKSTGKPGKGLRSFVNTLAMIERGDYQAAAKGMLNSKWATQDSPNRAIRRSQEMETGIATKYQ